jgi:hypothetical protein
MAATITTATKTASVVKTTKGSEKKWSEILSMNRRQDLQLPVNIEKYSTAFKRTYNCHQRQQEQTERTWAHKHETWYQDDFLFRNHLLKQLKPITRRFKHIDSLSPSSGSKSLSLPDLIDQQQQQQQQNEILNEDEIKILSLKQPVNKQLPPIEQTKKRSYYQDRRQSNNYNEQSERKKEVFSKLICPKILHEYEPRLYSHRHSEFLDAAQRFLKHKPEIIEKGIDSNNKQKEEQRKYLKTLIENEQERTRLAAIKFGKQLEDEKNKETDSNDFDDDYYYSQ